MHFDEFGYYFGDPNDGLKEKLRDIEGVPNAIYLVKDGLVFVFDKLVELVIEHQEMKPETPLSELARGLIMEATVPAKEAVERWGIVPEPYELVDHLSGGFKIRHRSFNALPPGEFSSKYDVQPALATLLVGGIQHGSGDFVYQGQPMTLCDSLDIAMLPPRPLIESEEYQSQQHPFTNLGDVAFLPGFEPVPEALFNDVKQLELEWKRLSNPAADFAKKHVAETWMQVNTLRLDELSHQYHEVPEDGQENLSMLRLLYPELAMLMDGTLYEWFDDYQVESGHMWTAYRDDLFLYYLLGRAAGCQHDSEMVGQWVAYALLRGNAPDDAFAFGQAVALYDSAICRLSKRIADAMHFMAKKDLSKPVTTEMDVLRGGRKYGVTAVVCTQAATDEGIAS